VLWSLNNRKRSGYFSHAGCGRAPVLATPVEVQTIVGLIHAASVGGAGRETAEPIASVIGPCAFVAATLAVTFRGVRAGKLPFSPWLGKILAFPQPDELLLIEQM
jgi:hypothetical protein